jgi:hypothetical protein
MKRIKHAILALSTTSYRASSNWHSNVNGKNKLAPHGAFL